MWLNYIKFSPAFSYFLKHLKENKIKVFIIIITGIFSLGFGIIYPLAYKYLIDEIIRKARYNILFNYGLILFFVMLISKISSYISQYLYAYLFQKYSMDLSTKIYYHNLLLPIDVIFSDVKGDILSRIMNDVGELQDFLSQIFYPLIINSLQILIIIIILYRLNPSLLLLGLSIIPVYIYISSVLSKKVRVVNKKIREKIGNVMGIIQESLNGIVEIKMMNLNNYFKGKFYNTLESIRKDRMDFIKYTILNTQSSDWLSSLMPITILFIGTTLVKNDFITLGTLIAYVTYINRLYEPVKAFLRMRLIFNSGLASLERIDETLNRETESNLKSGKIFDTLTNSIKLKNLSFKYKNSNSMIFNQTNLKLLSGKKIGIIGKNGQGKSTLIKIISGLINNYEGQVLFDEYNLRDLNLVSLRKQISLVSQDVFLFHTSIMENIRFGRIEASDQEVIGAAKKAYAHDFINKLPQKYQTYVTEGGTNLSGGEKQRIALARAILGKAAILILDEPTSAIDAETEKALIRAIQNKSDKQTIIMITHQSQLLQDFDLVVHIENSEVQEINLFKNLRIKTY